MQADVKNGQKETAIAKMGDYTIYAEEVESAIRNARQSGSPMQDVQAASQAIERAVQKGVIFQVATKNNIKMTDEELKRREMAQFEQTFQMGKLQMIMRGELKSNATDADFDAAVQKDLHKSVKEFRDEKSKQIDDTIKDPSGRSELFADIAGAALEESAASRLNPTDAEVKRQFETLNVKRIFIAAPTAGNDDSAEKAKKALADIKGGLSFEAAMNRYSKDPAPKGKTVSEAIMPYPLTSVANVPALAPLLKLKAGEMSDGIPVPGGLAIYKIDSIKSAVPADYDKKKSDYRKSYISGLARNQAQAEISEAAKNPKIEWISKGFEALYDFGKASKSHVSNAEQKKMMEDVEKKASTIAGSEGDQRFGALARFGASTYLYGTATETERKGMIQDRIEAVSQVLKYTESPQLRLELADLFFETKDNARSVDNLTQAARSNNDVDASGQSLYNAINARLEKLKKAGALKPEEAKEIEAQQTRWRDDRSQKDKAEAEQKIRDAADRKAAEEDIKKRAIEQKAQKTAVVPQVRTLPAGK